MSARASRRTKAAMTRVAMPHRVRYDLLEDAAPLAVTRAVPLRRPLPPATSWRVGVNRRDVHGDRERVGGATAPPGPDRVTTAHSPVPPPSRLAQRVCRRCGTVFRGPRCQHCERQRQRARPTAAERGYDPAWRCAREPSWLAARTSAARCAAVRPSSSTTSSPTRATRRGLGTRGTGSPRGRCNRRKTIAEEGALGRPRHSRAGPERSSSIPSRLDR